MFGDRHQPTHNRSVVFGSPTGHDGRFVRTGERPTDGWAAHGTVERDPSDKTLVTQVGGAEITVRPERPPGRGRAPVVLLRLVSPMFDALAVAYLGPAEARALAHALLTAPSPPTRPPAGIRGARPPTTGHSQPAPDEPDHRCQDGGSEPTHAGSHSR